MPSTRGLSFAVAASLAAALTNGAGSQGSRVIDIQVHSSALEENLLGDPAEQPVAVYLPPSYGASPERRYPVMYLLHGFADSHRPWAAGMGEAIEALSGTITEMIVVAPNGRNGYLSSYFVDSPVTGNWERYLSRELVAYVDRTYRTIAAPEGRALVGHSKGAFAAIRVAMRVPNVFGVVYAMSPCCLSIPAAVEAAPASVWERANGLTSQDAFRRIRDRVERGEGTPEETYLVGAIALSAAFSPDTSRPPMFVRLPFTSVDGRVQPDQSVLAQWERASPLSLVTEARANLLQLNALALDYGYRDAFTDIPRSARAFCAELAAAQIPHVCEAYDGGHEDRLRERVPTVVLPFLSRNLKSPGRSQ